MGIIKRSLKMKVAWAALTLASVLVLEASASAPWGTPQKNPILLECANLNNGDSNECEDLCKEYGKNNKDGEKHCANLYRCDARDSMPNKGVCNDFKECKTDEDCEDLGQITKKQAGRKCEDTHIGPIGSRVCTFDGSFKAVAKNNH